MDESSLIVHEVIESELDDLLLDLVYEIHSSLKGISDDQLDLANQNGTKTRQFSLPSSSSGNTSIEKQTCTCPHCGQTNIVAIRFAYHLAKCLGEETLFSRSISKKKKREIRSILIVKVWVDVPLVKQKIELLIKF